MEVTNPVKMDEATVKKLEEAFLRGKDISCACLEANISRKTYYNWIDSFPDLAERFHILQQNTSSLAYDNVYNKLKDGDLDTSKWLLERKKKNEFSTKTETESTHKIVGFNFIKNGDNTDNPTDTETGAGVE